ncbi:hypothetical protein N665_0012s0260 [Sinapis alba]|nr:hypothetical protein N665_0012s0260 [Sinapis alba]
MFQRHVHMVNIRGKSDEDGTLSLQRRLLKELLRDTDVKVSDETTHDSVARELLDKKVFLVLDNVSSKEQVDVLLGDHSWIKKGSRIVITTRDKTSLVQLQHTYVVPRLDLRDGLKHFSTYAFKDHTCPSSGNFKKLSEKFVDYARGNPLAIQILGGELLLKNEDHWSQKLDTLAQIPCPRIEHLLTLSYAELSKEQQETFLVVASFFRTGDEYYVRSLVDSGEISKLADKLLVSISSGRVEMHDLLYTFAMKLCSSVSCKTIWNHDSFTAAAKKKNVKFDIQPSEGKDQCNLQKERESVVKGISLDLSELTDKLPLDSEIFRDMCNLRYLKIYDSQCSRDCTDCKLNFPDGFNWSLENIRYLHWLQYPLKKLPKDVDPKNMVELSLPYSKITRLWKNVKDTSKLKWVDLSHSHELQEISGLVGSQNLQRLNLEGCINLKTLPQGMQNLRRLAYLNLRGCTSLAFLPEMKLSSLKILILSYCSELEKFQVISNDLEALYLEATAIKELPTSIGDLHKLVLLNMKDCKALASLPNCFGNLKALEELILSGCSKLESLPKLDNMEALKILLLDGTSIEQMPRLLHCPDSEGHRHAYADMPIHIHQSLSGRPGDSNGLSFSLLSLCLSGSKIKSLQANISQLYHLKWLDLKNCKELKSLPVLPPNLKCLDAHGCDSLEKVASPLATLAVTGQIHCSLIFTNCNKLDQAAKSNIISFTRKKGQLISDAHNRYNEGFVLDSLIGTCFPECEVPEMFDHQSFGSHLEQQLPRHWCDSKLIGIALCAVILFPEDYQQQNSRFLVKCTCKFQSEDKVCISFRSVVGGWSESGDEPRNIKSPHVFIGYTSWVDISKRHMEDHGNNEKGCIPSKVSLTFEVTDGATDVVKCEVLKCGFALVYTPNDIVYTPNDIDGISPSKTKRE